MQRYPGQTSGSWRFHYNGFDYREDNKLTIRTQEYRCCKKGCRGRAVHPRGNPENVTVKAIHNHPRDRDSFRTWQYRKCLKDKAKTDLNIPISKLFRDISREYADVAELVDPVSETRKMRRARRDMLPKCPSTYDELAELLVNDEQIKYSYGTSDPVPGRGDEREKFYQTALRGAHGTTLLFASPYLLEKCLSESTKGKVDATFSVLPMKPKGRQLLSVHATDGIYTFPVLFALMQSKKKDAYIQLFEYIKVLCPQWQPEEMTMDFEASLRNAFKTVFPNCRIVGCYFHYTQAVQKNWSQHGLMKVRKALVTKAKELKQSLLALALGPAHDIPLVFENIVESLPLSLLRKSESFLNYFKRTWLSENNMNFKPEDWSVYRLPDRTNNHVESFHSRLQLQHPNVWVFLQLLVDLIIESRMNFGRARNGHEIHPKIPRKVLLNDERVANATALFEAKRLTALQYIMWCRTSISGTLAAVRQGRRLKRYNRANFHQCEVDDIATSSDSSVDSYDFEFNPNPHQQERMEAEDMLFEQEWHNDMDVHGMQDEDELSARSESPPASDDSMWNEPEETQDLLMIRAAEDLDEEPTPFVAAPTNIEAAQRAPMSCVICLSEVATTIALPCSHALVCRGCKENYTMNECARCKQPIESFISAILT